MTTLPPTLSYNVETTLNVAFATAMAAFTRPAWLPAPSIVFDWTQIMASLPALAVAHLPVGTQDIWQGRHVGGGVKGERQTGIMEVSVFVTSDGNPAWRAQAGALRGMVTHWKTSVTALEISDFLTTPQTPTGTGYRVNIGAMADGATTADNANPAVQRARLLIDYSWTFRAS